MKLRWLQINTINNSSGGTSFIREIPRLQWYDDTTATWADIPWVYQEQRTRTSERGISIEYIGPEISYASIDNGGSK